MGIERDIARGLKAGWQTANKFGYNKDIDSGVEETIWPNGGTVTLPTAAQTLNIVSSSVDDDFGGTGCQYLRIDGLDADYNEVVEDVFMDGTTTVTTTNSFIAVNRCVGILFGTGKTNAGTITVTQTTSGITVASVLVGVSITQQLIYTVPAGKEAQLDWLWLRAIKPSGGSAPQVRFLFYSFVPQSNGTYITIDETVDTSDGGILDIRPPHANEIAEKTTIYINAISDQNNTIVSGRFYLTVYPYDAR